MEHNCNKETEIELIKKSMVDIKSDIAELRQEFKDGINNVKEDVKFNMNEFKTEAKETRDYIRSSSLAYEKNNSNIKQLLTESFSDIRLNFEKEKEKAKSEMIEEINKREKEYNKRFANKLAERAIYYLIGLICTTVIIALLSNYKI